MIPSRVVIDVILAHDGGDQVEPVISRPPHQCRGGNPLKNGIHAMALAGNGCDCGRMTKSDISTMLAVRQETHGSPEVLEVIEVPRPVPGMSEVLIAVRAAGVNPTDWWNRARSMTIDRLPLVLGWDVSGVVEAVGPRRYPVQGG